MEHTSSAPNERVLRTTQLAKLSLNHPSVVLTADVFQYFYKILLRPSSLVSGVIQPPRGIAFVADPRECGCSTRGTSAFHTQGWTERFSCCGGLLVRSHVYFIYFLSQRVGFRLHNVNFCFFFFPVVLIFSTTSMLLCFLSFRPVMSGMLLKKVQLCYFYATKARIY